MKFLLLLLCVFSFRCLAQSDEYQLNGSLGINSVTKKKIEFSLKWSETGGKAIGTYSDNYYTRSAILKGISGNLGRIFVVTFPMEIKGVQTISFLGSDFKKNKQAVSVPLSVILRNKNGKPINTTSILASLSGASTLTVAQKQEEPKCQTGFGALAGYCGIYTGLVTEEIDNKQKCNLLAFSNTHLVLDENAEIGLVLGEMSAIVSPPIHRIGRFFTDTTSNRIDVMSRHCRPIQGTIFAGDDCKRLNLTGTFTMIKEIRHFSGRYSITDEKTNEFCRYGLSMDQSM